MSIGDNGSGQLPDKQLVNKGRWKPGESGNPKGRPPKGISITSLVKELLSQIPDIEEDGVKNDKTWAELISLALVKGAVKGNAPLLKETLDRIDGKVVERVQAEVDPAVLAMLERQLILSRKLQEVKVIEGEYEELPDKEV